MTTEGLSSRIINIFGIILGLVFCSYVVSYKFIDIVYLLSVLYLMLNYVSLKRIK